MGELGSDKMKKLLFILNPRSGKGQIKNQLLDILNIFQRNGYRVQLHITQEQIGRAHV